jgi:uncharacterized Tic20 family protein
MLAAAAHLSLLIGFWLLGPIIIYVVKRKESRFVAFYAAQAVVLQILFTVATVLAVPFWIVGVAGASLLRQPAVGAIATILPLAGGAAAFGGLLLAHAYAAYSAWQGKSASLPVVGRIATSIVRGDEGAAKA